MYHTRIGGQGEFYPIDCEYVIAFIEPLNKYFHISFIQPHHLFHKSGDPILVSARAFELLAYLAYTVADGQVRYSFIFNLNLETNNLLRLHTRIHRYVFAHPCDVPFVEVV